MLGEKGEDETRTYFKHGHTTDDFGQTKVRDLDDGWIIPSEEDILRFEISMSDSMAMDVLVEIMKSWCVIC